VCLHVPTSAYVRLRVPTCAYKCLQVPTCAFKCLHVPTCAYMCLQMPTYVRRSYLLQYCIFFLGVFNQAKNAHTLSSSLYLSFSFWGFPSRSVI